MQGFDRRSFDGHGSCWDEWNLRGLHQLSHQTLAPALKADAPQHPRPPDCIYQSFVPLFLRRAIMYDPPRWILSTFSEASAVLLFAILTVLHC